MKRVIISVLSIAVVALSVLAGMTLTQVPVHAQNSEACYAVADNGASFGPEDALVTLNRVTGETTLIGRTGSTEIEAIAFAPGGGSLYASDEEELGILDLSSGAFSALGGEYGSGDGAAGNLALDDVDGLSYDATSGILYGTHRRDGEDRDLLFQIDRSTGAYVDDAFGAGVDYVVIDGPGVMGDIDDIAVDPITGVMYAASNLGGDGGVLITVDKSTGAGTLVGEFGVDDIEGLAFFNDGRLYGSTGKDGRTPGTRNQLYLIDETTAAATLVAPFSDFRDYEALDCLVEPTAVSLSGISANSIAAPGVYLLALGMLGLVTLGAIRRTDQ